MKVRAFFTIGSPNFNQGLFVVNEIRLNKPIAVNQIVQFTDYALADTTYKGKTPLIRLRAIRLPEPEDDQTHYFLVLALDDEMEYNDQFHHILSDESCDILAVEDDHGKAEYSRSTPDVCFPHRVHVEVVEDVNNGRPKEVTEEISFWEYHRQVELERGMTVREYLFIELNERTRHFQMWKGREVEQSLIQVEPIPVAIGS